MANEPQRDIEKDLLAYKQRRHEQLSAPMELHPATRKMLQGEAARAASRPLLTSEEAAKNFVRSFVMSHQQPGFFARHKQRVIWGGAMFACLAVVLAVLRNDPRLEEQRRAFPDPLPTPQPVADPQAAKPQAALAAGRSQTEGEQLARAKQSAPAADKLQELVKVAAAPVGNPAPASQRGATVGSAPPTVKMREAVDRRSVAAPTPATPPAMPTPISRAASAPAPTSGPAVAKAESATRDLDRKLAEKNDAVEPVQLAKSLKATQPLGLAFEAEAKKSTDEMKLKRSVGGDLKRGQLGDAAVLGGGAGAAPVAASFAASAPQVPSAFATSDNSQTRQRFLQLDNQAGYRKNFNSPPMPQVMQDFAFERTGDRVRIVDADGSTYVGTVMPAPVEEARAKSVSQLDAMKRLKDAPGQQSQSGGAQAADAQTSYRFYANGVNRKLNQSVEFRGEWQPAAPAQQAPATPALQQARFGAERLEAQAAEKKEKVSVTNALAGNPAPVQAYHFLQQQKESSQGRISGRAVVGGKNEFDINAVPK
ncbi:MAG: hypothetical protein ABMA26_02565 [Limisphaerales bacterium]